MHLFCKILLKLTALISFLFIFFSFQDVFLNKLFLLIRQEHVKINESNHYTNLQNPATVKSNFDQDFNVWCIFCKAASVSSLKKKFSVFSNSLIRLSSIPLTLHVVTDNNSMPIAKKILYSVRNETGKIFKVHLYDVRELAEKISSIITLMQRYFTSQPNTYYSDALFFLSIGLYQIAINQDRIVMVDIDTKFEVDVKLLFNEFDMFGNDTLLGIAPELSPVYRHVLHNFRAKYRNTNFGNPLWQKGNPGVNSGVLLLHLARMRESDLYKRLLSPGQVEWLVEKYMFHGNLGDQDWYTLISQEYKNLVYFLDCTWNRQLCQWWNHHGYKNVFKMYYHCEGKPKILHGNCNTQIP